MYRTIILIFGLLAVQEACADQLGEISRNLKTRRERESTLETCDMKMENVCDQSDKQLFNLAKKGECASKKCMFQPTIGLAEHPYSQRFRRNPRAIMASSKRILYSFQGMKGEVCTIRNQPCACRNEDRCSCKGAIKTCKQQYRVERTYFVVYNTGHQSHVVPPHTQQKYPQYQQPYGQPQYPQTDQSYGQQYGHQTPYGQQYPPNPYGPQYGTPQGPSYGEQVQYGEEPQARSGPTTSEEDNDDKQTKRSLGLPGFQMPPMHGDPNAMYSMPLPDGGHQPYPPMPQQPYYPHMPGSGNMQQSELQKFQMLIQNLQHQPSGYPMQGYPPQGGFPGYNPNPIQMPPFQPQPPPQGGFPGYNPNPVQMPPFQPQPPPYYPVAQQPMVEYQPHDIPPPPPPPAPEHDKEDSGDDLKETQDMYQQVYPPPMPPMHAQYQPAYPPPAPQYPPQQNVYPAPQYPPQQNVYPQYPPQPPMQQPVQAPVHGSSILTSTLFNFFLMRDKGSSTRSSFMKIIPLLMANKHYSKMISFQSLYIMVPNGCKCERQLQRDEDSYQAPSPFYPQPSFNHFNPYASQMPGYPPYGSPFQMGYPFNPYSQYGSYPSRDENERRRNNRSRGNKNNNKD